MSKGPTFEHHHYKAIAAILARMMQGPDAEPKAGLWLVERFADELKGTNPNYNRERFTAAAMGTPSNGRDKVR